MSKHCPPLELRELKAQMVLKNLNLRELAKRAKVEYFRASEVLNNRRNDPHSLSELRKAIERAPMPKEVAHA